MLCVNKYFTQYLLKQAFVVPKSSDYIDLHQVPLGSAVRMGRRNLFAGRLNGSRAAQILPESPRKAVPPDRDGRRCL
jgi:hypothetical protein